MVRERVVVGEPLPPTVELRTVPSHTEYRYAVVNDRRVIVEPRTRKVSKSSTDDQDDDYRNRDPRGSTGSRGDFSCQDVPAIAGASPDDPVECRGGRKADAGRQRIDHKILQPRVPSRRPELQDFDQAGEATARTAVSSGCGVGEAESEAEQHEGKRMLAVLSEIWMRPESGGPSVAKATAAASTRRIVEG